ncbi:MAG: carboxypeptidase-like regulatory domain-containing protein [Pirellulaceae bacterium]|nr:carboxypeptidase-like regulatory domain-containing protein [Pirellulaceae bacterium]HJN10198.1 carboxypeptidase-like regulatory domain-containing protein [Pirellulaceae bacterium]
MRSQFDSMKGAIRFVCGIGLLLTTVGCSSKLPVVSGAVSLDGQPLAGATVIFMPENELLSPAQGTTDASSNYTLEQEADVAGIQPGEYSVRITTFQPASQDTDPATPAIKEKVPARYNLETALNAVVGAEQDSVERPHNFELRSGGEIFQPASDSF